jgi:hypothetical protein
MATTTMTMPSQSPTWVENYDNHNENDDRLKDNIALITTLSGPTKGREFSKQIKMLYLNDQRPIVKFYKLLNLKPYKQPNKFEETKVMQMMKDHPEICMGLYRFEAFSQDLLHPLHMLCTLNASVDMIKFCVKCCQAALYYDASAIGAPIHYACMFNAPFDTIRWLVKKDIDALELPNSDHGMTPLHLAIQYEVDFNTVAFLTDRCPAAASMVDHDGMTPLHHAITRAEPQLDIVEDLTEVCPDACECICTKGLTPLLLGIYLNVDETILHDLIISNPKSVSIPIKTNNDRIVTSLRLAIEKKLDIKIMRDIVRADPMIVQVIDDYGNLPVHTAVEVRHTNMDLYQLLACKYPDGLEIENHDQMTPHQLAKKKLLPLYPTIVEFLNPYEEV